MSYYDTINKAPVVRPYKRQAKPGVKPVYERFAKGQSLIVTDCFGKEWSCKYVGMDGKQAIISINGGKMACDPSQLKKIRHNV